MTDLLGLPGLRVAGPVIETAGKVAIPVEPLADPACSKCGCADLKADGHKDDLIITDTPMRGKPADLIQKRPRLVCRQCGGFAYQRSANYHATRAITKRLVRYIEGAVCHRNLEEVAKETGLSAKQITRIANDLVDRLQPTGGGEVRHRFAQPDIVAMDGIQCNDARFQIISDGRTGRPLAMSKSWEAEPAWKAMIAAIDVTKVRVFVTDMHVTNKSLATTLRRKCKALHVADRFHVIHACNQAMSRVINHEVQKLRSKNRAGDATALLAMKAKIEGKRTAEERQTQIEFDFDRPPSILAYPAVLAAHQARMQLIHFYSSTDRETASRRLLEFERRALHPLIAARFEKVRKYIGDHQPQVLNYFDALERDTSGQFIGFDTSRAERRNGNIKAIWRDMRGGGFRLFLLRVLYHPYNLHNHFIEHGCGHFEGPLQSRDILARAHMPAGTGSRDKCAQCATGARVRPATLAA